MAVNIGNATLKSAYVGSTPLKAIYVGATQVWSSKQVVKISGSARAQAQLRDAIAAYGGTYQTVTELPFLLDTSRVTNMSYMFDGCSALTSVPDMDTSKVTNMAFMFQGCSALTSVPDMDTSKVTDMAFMFYDCSALTSVPDMDTSRVTNMFSMFYDCSALTDGNIRLIRPDGTKPTNRTNMIFGSGLTREPFFLPDGTPIN